MKRKNNFKNKNLTAQHFMNIKEIADDYIYSNDGFVFYYIKVNGIDTLLYTEDEKERMINNLSANFSDIAKYPFKFFAVSKPSDIKDLIEFNKLQLESENDYIKRDLIKEEINELINQNLKGETVEREFYFMVWEKVKNQSKAYGRAKDIVEAFEDISIKAKIINKREIYIMLNLINNGIMEEI